VEAEDFFFEGFQAAGGGFNQEEVFAGGFDFTFPAVDGFHRGGVDVDASGEVFFEDGAGDFAGFGERGTGYEDEAELGGHGSVGGIVTDSRKEKLNTEAQRTQRNEDEEEGVLWRSIVRVHPQVQMWSDVG
jgi:hypothetical protein